MKPSFAQLKKLGSPKELFESHSWRSSEYSEQWNLLELKGLSELRLLLYPVRLGPLGPERLSAAALVGIELVSWIRERISSALMCCPPLNRLLTELYWLHSRLEKLLVSLQKLLVLQLS